MGTVISLANSLQLIQDVSESNVKPVGYVAGGREDSQFEGDYSENDPAKIE